MNDDPFQKPIAPLRLLYRGSLPVAQAEPEKHADGHLWNTDEVACFLAVSEETSDGCYGGGRKAAWT
jgi:hypothetical protein